MRGCGICRPRRSCSVYAGVEDIHKSVTHREVLCYVIRRARGLFLGKLVIDGIAFKTKRDYSHLHDNDPYS